MPQQYVVILAMFNPTVVGIVLLRNLLWVGIGILAVAFSTVSAVYLYKHVEDKKALRRLMRSTARRLRPNSNNVVSSPPVIQQNRSPLRLLQSPYNASSVPSRQIRQIGSLSVTTRSRARNNL